VISTALFIVGWIMALLSPLMSPPCSLPTRRERVVLLVGLALIALGVATSGSE